MPGIFDLNLYRGDSYAYRFILWADEDQTQPLDLDGSTVEAEIRDKLGGSVIVPLTCTVILPNNVDVVITPEQYSQIPKKGVWDLEITFASGAVHTAVRGVVAVSADVTNSTPGAP